MAKPSGRVALFLSQVFFTVALAPLFAFPKLAQSGLARWITAYFFGRLPAKRYTRVIDFYGEAYGAALKAGLDRAISMSAVSIDKVIDCGTGTGFAARSAAAKFNGATIIGVDLSSDMLEQAREAAAKGNRVLYVFGDILHLPFADSAIDIVIAHNTIPFLAEFGRVCRPGGAVIFVDTAARWAAPLARNAARQTGCFDEVAAEQAGLGFYLVARRTGR